VTDHIITQATINDVFYEILEELKTNPVLLAKTESANIGKWGMAKLWRSWMTPTTKYLVSNGAKMPLVIKPNGETYGEREFNTDDCHEYFTSLWLGLDKEGTRLSWSKSGRDGRRAATKGERFLAMQKHSEWASERGIILHVPRDSEYSKLNEEQNV